ncbi:C3a anaphylatoxin chemotactic receptor [Labeo rohita]|uniref:C3a anaphylatoxin chemotactic receptor n=1 Tax=Labeo rohita TaxID=84645 RepID=A0ABQ8L745_LABRO|nr:C3a anaphylatoxin chemotactic receptor [Labeo rohita]
MEDYYDILEYPMRVISLVFYYLTLILCVPENTFVLYVAGLKMKRTVNTVRFLSLEIADLLCCLSTLYYVTESALDDHWLLPFMMLRDTYTVNNQTYCLHYQPDEDSYKMYGRLCIIRFVFGFLVPLICITTCYGFIARKAGVVFTLDELNLIILYGEESSSWAALAVNLLTISLGYFNSCLNPILYVFMGQDFKSNVKLSLRRVFERVFSEEGTQMFQTTNHCKCSQCSEDISSFIQSFLIDFINAPPQKFMPMKRTVNTVGFLNLAIADLLCCLSTLYYVTESTLDDHWLYECIMCKILPFIMLITMFASVFTLSLISDHTGLGSKSSQPVNCTTVLHDCWTASAVYPLTISLAYFNSCLNPILYVFMGQDFESNVKLSLRHIFERVFSEEGTQMSQTTQSQHMQSV